MTAREILALASRAGIAPGVTVVDLCCGVAGPGLLIARTLGCHYLGVDQGPHAVAVARSRARAAGLDAVFDVAHLPPVPSGPFEVVLLIETFLAFRDKATLLREISSTLLPGGRLAFTVEVGEPLSPTERHAMPDSGTVWLTRLTDLLTDLERAGLRVDWLSDVSRSHQTTAEALAGAYAAARDDIAASAVDLAGTRDGAATVDDLVSSHRLWSRWLAEGRVRKLAVVAQKVAT